jgi:hypothetical protein
MTRAAYFPIAAIIATWVLLAMFAALQWRRKSRRANDLPKSRSERPLTDAEVDELFAPRRRPIRPEDFRVVERGRPVRFDDDRRA